MFYTPNLLNLNLSDINRKNESNNRSCNGASLVAQVIKNLPAMQETRVPSLDWEVPRRRKWQPTAVFLPGESRGQRILAGYSPCGCKQSDTTEWVNSSSMLRTTIYDYLKTIFSHLEMTLSQVHNWMDPLIWTVMSCRVSISYFYFPIFLDRKAKACSISGG